MRYSSIAVGFVLLIGCGKSDSTPAPGSESAPEAAAPASVAPSSVDVCSLVTEAEAESALGKSVAVPQKQPSGDCWYLKEGGSGFGDVEFILAILPVRMESAGAFDTFIKDQVDDLNASMKKSGLPVSYTVKPAPEVGSPAYFMELGLYALKGDRILMVGLDGPKAVAIAKTALARMP